MAATALSSRFGRTAILAAAETNQLITGSGILRRIVVNNVGSTMTLDVYDHASTTTNKILEWVSADGKVRAQLDIPFANGLRTVVGGTPGSIVLVWEGRSTA